jgi:hypothetical protein
MNQKQSSEGGSCGQAIFVRILYLYVHINR